MDIAGDGGRALVTEVDNYSLSLSSATLAFENQVGCMFTRHRREEGGGLLLSLLVLAS